MKNKVMTAQEAVKNIGDGATIMVGGFMACGTPEHLIDALVSIEDHRFWEHHGVDWFRTSSAMAIHFS